MGTLLIYARNVVDKSDDKKSVRVAYGLLAAIPLPIVGAAFPLTALFSGSMLMVKRLKFWPSHLKWIVRFALIGAVFLAVSAFFQDIAIPRENVIFFTATALFTMTAAKMTTGTDTGAESLAYVALGTVGFFLIFGTEYTNQSPEFFWKFGASFPIIILGLWWACRGGKARRWAWVTLIAAALICLFSNFRSQALICVVVLMVWMVKGKRGVLNITKALAAAGAVAAAVAIVVLGIESGFFGREIQQKTLDQESRSGGGILGGRVEPPLAFTAIVSKPFFGWGNVNEIDQETISKAHNLAYSLGMDPSQYLRIWIREGGEVSIHSILFEPWVEGGILAALLPIALLLLFIQGIWIAQGKWAPMILFVSAQGIWDVLFSPWSQNRSILLAGSAVLVAWAIAESRNTQAGRTSLHPLNQAHWNRKTRQLRR